MKIGTDIEKVERVASLLEKNGGRRVFSERELEYIKSRGEGALQSAAGIFCAKEAFSKAVGTGISGFSLTDVEVLHDALGAPYLSFSGKLSGCSFSDFSLSISHTDETAVATVLFDGELPTSKKRRYVLSSSQMRAADAAVGNSLLLMENAAKALFNVCFPLGKTFVILCGRGNNGGDGVCLASLLSKKDKDVTVVFSEEGSLSSDSEYYFERLDKNVSHFVFSEETEEKTKKLLSESDVAVDCVFGTGFHGELPPHVKKLLSYINIPTVACDIPSGINADTGEVSDGAHPADKTVVLAAEKPCAYLFGARDFFGEVAVADIGIAEDVLVGGGVFAEIITEKAVRSFVTERFENSNKGSYGTLLTVCGSEKMPGAAILSLKGALASGVGLCIANCDSSVFPAVCAAVPEAIYSETDRLPTAALVGCGLTPNKKAVEEVVKRNVPTLFDADALNVMAAFPEILKGHTAQKIMTPHPGEMARLCKTSVSEIEKNRFSVALKFAEEYDTVLLLKGRYTVIATPDGRLWISDGGNDGLAKGGSGDVLAGFISGLLASGFSAEGAAVCGVYCQGRAAETLLKKKGRRGFSPSDVAEYLGRFIPENK